jgi:hypothetical protein
MGANEFSRPPAPRGLLGVLVQVRGSSDPRHRHQNSRHHSPPAAWPPQALLIQSRVFKLGAATMGSVQPPWIHSISSAVMPARRRDRRY